LFFSGRFPALKPIDEHDFCDKPSLKDIEIGRLTSADAMEDYPMLTGSVCITSKTRTTTSTLQMMAPIPAFMAGSMLWLRRRNDAAFVALVFGGISFALSP
jgi:hypothetical protein